MKMNVEKNQKLADEIELVVDYTKTIKQTIADGKYDWRDININAKNFPISPKLVGKKMKVRAKLFQFNRDMSSGGIIFEMDNAGYQPATLMELLTLGILFPELQRQFSIVALNSAWRDYGCRHVPYINVDRFLRGLSLVWFDSVWRASPYCFLGVRKYRLHS